MLSPLSSRLMFLLANECKKKIHLIIYFTTFPTTTYIPAEILFMHLIIFSASNCRTVVQGNDYSP